MQPTYTYFPLQFYFIILLPSLLSIPLAIYFSNRDQPEKMLPFLLINLLIPAITAVAMIYLSGSKEMVKDFWTRLFLFKIQPSYLAIILLLMPCAILLATALSPIWLLNRAIFPS